MQVAPAHSPPFTPDAYAVIGNPIAQSKSPLIHGLFAQATGQCMAYTALQAELGGFAAAVDAFRAAGGRGLNVTAPFKLDAFAYATQHSPSARLAGAANALKFDGEQVWAENFDGVGLVRDVVHNLGVPMRGRTVLLLGAGGATRGVLLPFLQEGPASLTIVNRTLDKAQQLVEQLSQSTAQAWGGVGAVSAVSFDGLLAHTPPGGFDLVFNATSSSLQAQGLPLAGAVFSAGGLAYDLSYGKGLTPFLQQAQAAGVSHVADGVGMLAEQAAEAFAWWRGVRPDTQEVIARLRVPLV